MLTSKFGTLSRRKYCDDCAIKEKRRLNAIYQKRAYQKRVGNKVTPINLKNILAIRKHRQKLSKYEDLLVIEES